MLQLIPFIKLTTNIAMENGLFSSCLTYGFNRDFLVYLMLFVCLPDIKSHYISS